eukprot:11501850-Karenia_brevis.AAC.1
MMVMMMMMMMIMMVLMMMTMTMMMMMMMVMMSVHVQLPRCFPAARCASPPSLLSVRLHSSAEPCFTEAYSRE